jgi:hypothetical protein
MNTTEIDQVFHRAQQIAAVDGMTEYQREQLAIRSNYERLKRDRLQRESEK